MKKLSFCCLPLLLGFCAGAQNPFVVTIISPSNTITCSNPSVVPLAASSFTGSYFWASPSASYAGSSPTLTIPGNYTVTFTSGNSSSSQTISVGVNTVAPVSMITPTFQNVTCNLADAHFSAMISPTPGVTHQWLSPLGGVFTATTAMSVYTAAVGVYTHVATNNTNGCITVKTATVTSSTGFPSFSITPLSGGYNLGCGTNSLVFNLANGSTDPMGGPVSYTLLSPGSSTVLPTGNLSTNFSYTITQPGIYSAVIRDNSTFCTTRAYFTVTQYTTGPNIIIAPSATAVCPGDQVTLNAFGATGYSFLPSGSNGVPFTLNAPTTFTVSGMNPANNCTGSSTILIGVNPSPSLTIVASPSIVCQNGTVALTASGADTYAWSHGITNGVAFTPTASANYTVTGTSTLSGCKSTATQSLGVGQSPILAVSVSHTSVCQGDALTLTASGASTYSWSGGITNGVAFTPSATADYTLTGYDNAGCTSTYTINIPVLAKPVLNISGSDPIYCTGMATTLTASGASNYQWSTGGTSASIVVGPMVTTVYTVTGSASGGNCSAQQTFTLSPDTTTKFAYTVDSMLVTLQITGLGCTTFTWDYGNGITNNINPNPAFTYNTPGVYSICLRCSGLPNACIKCFNVIVPGNFAGGVGITELSKQGLEIFPNPSRGEFQVSAIVRGTFYIYSGLGLLVHEQEVESGRNTVKTGLAPGIYFYVCGSASGKLVVE